MMRAYSSCLAVVFALTFASRASAGGYDTPILYSARHMGMGGTEQRAHYVPIAKRRWRTPRFITRQISLPALVSQIVRCSKNGSSFKQKVYERVWQKSSSNLPAYMQTGRSTKLRSNTHGGGWHWIG